MGKTVTLTGKPSTISSLGKKSACMKDGTLGAVPPKTIGVYILPRYAPIQNLKEIRQEIQLRERTQECQPKMTFDPIKDGMLGAAPPKAIGM